MATSLLRDGAHSHRLDREKRPAAAGRRRNGLDAEMASQDIGACLVIMDPQVLLVDEPSSGLEPRFIDMVFEILLEHPEVARQFLGG